MQGHGLDDHPLVEMVRNRQGQIDLELVDYQIAKINSLREQAIVDVNRSIAQKEKGRAREILDRYHKDVLGVLLPEQTRRLSWISSLIEMHQSGLVNVLSSGSLSVELALTDEEKSRVLANAEKMEQYLKVETEALRQKAINLLIADLPANKRSSVLKFVDFWKKENFLNFGLLTKPPRNVGNCEGCEITNESSRK